MNQRTASSKQKARAANASFLVDTSPRETLGKAWSPAVTRTIRAIFAELGSLRQQEVSMMASSVSRPNCSKREDAERSTSETCYLGDWVFRSPDHPITRSPDHPIFYIMAQASYFPGAFHT